MIKNAPTEASRSAGIAMTQDLIDVLDDLCALMSENGVMPSRSQIARDLLWAGIALVKSSDPRAAELLRLVGEANLDDAGSGVRPSC